MYLYMPSTASLVGLFFVKHRAHEMCRGVVV